MKKTLNFIAVIFFAFALISCGAKIDSSNWLTNLDEGKKAAQKENKKILLFFSNDEMDGKSAKLKEKIFNTEEFLDSFTEKYVLVNLDYSNSQYENEQEAIKGDLRIYELYNVSTLPYFLVLSSEGFVITQLVFDDLADFDSVRLTFDDEEDTIRNFEELLAKTKNGSTESRLEAINQIVEITEPSFAYQLMPLNELYISLDKKNKTGKVLNHLVALTYSKAIELSIDNEIEKAAEEFVKLTKNKILTDDDKQMAFYTAGYILAQGGSENFEKILEYFQKAYEIAPESEAGQNIKMSIEKVQELINGENEEAQE